MEESDLVLAQSTPLKNYVLNGTLKSQHTPGLQFPQEEKKSFDRGFRDLKCVPHSTASMEATQGGRIGSPSTRTALFSSDLFILLW